MEKIKHLFAGITGPHLYNHQKGSEPLHVSWLQLLSPISEDLASELESIVQGNSELFQEIFTPFLPHDQISELKEDLDKFRIAERFHDDLFLLAHLPHFIDSVTSWILSWIQTPEQLVSIRSTINQLQEILQDQPNLTLGTATNAKVLSLNEPMLIKRFIQEQYSFNPHELKKLEVYDGIQLVRKLLDEQRIEEEMTQEEFDKILLELKKSFLKRERAKDIASYIALYAQYHKIFDLESKRFHKEVISLIRLLFDHSRVFKDSEDISDSDVRSRIRNWLKPNRSFFYKSS